MAKKNSITTFKKVINELSSPDKRKPIYYFCGEENFFLDKLQDAVEEVIPPEHKDFNFDLIYARDKSPEQVLGIARSFPMMAEKRVLIVRDFLSLNVDSYNQTGRGGGLDNFIPYLQQPNPSTLIALFDEKKPNGRTKLGKAIKKNKKVGYYEFKEVKDYLLPDWVIDWTKEHHNKEIDPEAAQMLTQLAGNNLQILSTEIDKVCTFIDGSPRVKNTDIKKIIGTYREYSVFELKDALFDRNLEQCLFITEQMLQQSKTNTGEIIGTVGFFYSVFTNIWQIQCLAAKGNNRQQIQNALGINSKWYFNKLWKDASRFKLAEMPRIFEALLDADSAAKGFTTLKAPTIFLLLFKRIIN